MQRQQVENQEVQRTVCSSSQSVQFLACSFRLLADTDLSQIAVNACGEVIVQQTQRVSHSSGCTQRVSHSSGCSV